MWHVRVSWYHGGEKIFYKKAQVKESGSGFFFLLKPTRQGKQVLISTEFDWPSKQHEDSRHEGPWPCGNGQWALKNKLNVSDKGVDWASGLRPILSREWRKGKRSWGNLLALANTREDFSRRRDSWSTIINSNSAFNYFELFLELGRASRTKHIISGRHKMALNRTTYSKQFIEINWETTRQACI